MGWRHERVNGERRGTKRTIKVGGDVTTSVYLDDMSWRKFQLERVRRGKSAREMIVLAKQLPGDNLSDQLRLLING